MEELCADTYSGRACGLPADHTDSHQFNRDLRPVAVVVAEIRIRVDKLKRENPSWRQHPPFADIACLLRLQERAEDLAICEFCDVLITPENFNVCGTCYNKTVNNLHTLTYEAVEMLKSLRDDFGYVYATSVAERLITRADSIIKKAEARPIDG